MLISISLTEFDRCLLKEGQEVDFDTPFLEKKVEEEVNISVAKKLGVPPQKIFNYLKKFVGETIEENEVIAVNKGLFSTKRIVSKHSGQIKEINHSDGSISIVSKTKVDDTMKAYFKGKVDKIRKNELLIEVGKGEQYPAKNVSQNFGGKSFYSNENSNFLSENLYNSVVICEAITPYLKAKAEALGCQGFCSLTKLDEVSDIPFAQFKNLNDFKKAVKSQLSYCTLVSASSMIYFYQ